MILPELDDLLKRVKREEARESLNLFAVLNHASQGSAKENKTFLEALKSEAKIGAAATPAKKSGGLANFLNNIR